MSEVFSKDSGIDIDCNHFVVDFVIHKNGQNLREVREALIFNETSFICTITRSVNKEASITYYIIKTDSGEPRILQQTSMGPNYFNQFKKCWETIWKAPKPQSSMSTAKVSIMKIDPESSDFIKTYSIDEVTLTLDEGVTMTMRDDCVILKINDNEHVFDWNDNAVAAVKVGGLFNENDDSKLGGKKELPLEQHSHVKVSKGVSLTKGEIEVASSGTVTEALPREEVPQEENIQFSKGNNGTEMKGRTEKLGHRIHSLSKRLRSMEMWVRSLENYINAQSMKISRLNEGPFLTE